MRPIVERIYRDPDIALAALGLAAAAPHGDPRELGATVAESPERFGELRGSDGLMHGRQARSERAEAQALASQLAVQVREQAVLFKRSQAVAYERHRIEGEHESERRRLAHEVPEPSPALRVFLDAPVDEQRAALVTPPGPVT
jgi:exodeoxyribonuclease-5